MQVNASVNIMIALMIHHETFNKSGECTLALSYLISYKSIVFSRGKVFLD